MDGAVRRPSCSAVPIPATSDAITAQAVRKVFRTFDRRPGFLGALRDLGGRRYKELVAVQDITLSVPKGQIVGYIGPNGAGKSTTIKMLTGILTPSSGTVRVAGFDPFRERSAYVRQVGAVFGQRSQLWWDLAVGESFDLLRHLYGVSEADFKTRLARFDQVLELTPFLRTPVRKLSLGQRMKADLAASLLHNPKVLFLDEPTVGVDVVTKARLRDFLGELNREQGTTIVLTTHDMQDIEALAHRVVVIDHGRIVHDGDVGSLAERFGGGKRLRLTLAKAVAQPPVLPGITWTTTSPVQLTAALERGADCPAVLQKLLGLLPVADVTIEEPPIEEVITALYSQTSTPHP